MNQESTKLERLLTRVTPVPPAEGLRQRVLAEASAAAGRPVWSFVEGVAACLLVGMNLALAVGLTAPGPHRLAQAPAPEEARRQIQALGIDPEMAGIARLGLPPETAPVAPRLDVRLHRPFNGEL